MMPGGYEGSSTSRYSILKLLIFRNQLPALVKFSSMSRLRHLRSDVHGYDGSSVVASLPLLWDTKLPEELLPWAME